MIRPPVSRKSDSAPRAWRAGGRFAWCSLILMTHLAVPAARTQESPAERLLKSSRPLVIAHRGFSALLPENTLPAFAAARAAGADLIELDYHHSRDDVPIVIHDATLDRTTDACARWGGEDLAVNGRSAGELGGLEAGLWFDPPVRGVRLPRLSEALDVIQSGSVTLIERKGGDARTCVELLRQRELVNRVVVQSFDWAYLKAFHQLAPRQVLGALGPPGTWKGKKLSDEEKALTAGWVDEVERLGARLVVWNRQVNRAAIKAAHAKGMGVWVYTINEPEIAVQLIDTGVDGLITDNPALLWRTLALRQRP